MGKGCVLYIFRVNKSKPDMCLVSKAGFVIEGLSNVGYTWELVYWGLDKSEEKLTDYIFFPKYWFTFHGKPCVILYFFYIHRNRNMCLVKNTHIEQMMGMGYWKNEFSRNFELYLVMKHSCCYIDIFLDLIKTHKS